MVAAFDYCLHGRGGAAPSIDTAMHGLVEAAHVDHLHPDSGIALATAADGEALTRECFGDRVAWLPWRRPGFQLGLDTEAARAANPDAIGVILGGHGITAWGATSDECRGQLPGDHREARRRSSPSTASRTRSARSSRACEPLSVGRASRSRRGPRSRSSAGSLRPTVTRSGTSPTPTSSSTSCPRERLGVLAALGTSCPDHFLRTKVRPMVLDLPPTAPLEETATRLRELHEAYRADYTAYYDAQRHRRLAGDARRRPGDRPACPASACSPSVPTSRPPGSPASSTSTRST